jgi:hypothetical protein
MAPSVVSHTCTSENLSSFPIFTKMATPISILVRRLKRTTEISSNPEYDRLFSDIDRYGDNDASKAYLLGCFFKNTFDTDNLSIADKKFLISTIKEHGLEKYYYLQEHPKPEFGFAVLYILMLGGIACLIAGSYQLYYSRISVGLSIMYLQPIIREGGWTIIAGLVFLVGGFSQFRFQQKRKQLFTSFDIK